MEARKQGACGELTREVAYRDAPVPGGNGGQGFMPEEGDAIVRLFDNLAVGRS
jgi:hypothetical protein